MIRRTWALFYMVQFGSATGVIGFVLGRVHERLHPRNAALSDRRDTIK